MLISPDLAVWTGRDDSHEAGDVRRLFQIVRTPLNGFVPANASAILGFACDAGVARNKGRVGAHLGPRVIRQFLSGLPAHHHTELFDCGDVACLDDNLESAQALLGERVLDLLSMHVTPVVIGGGHEIAWGSYLGLKKWLEAQERDPGAQTKKRKLLILNLDAHFDLRSSRPANSGTPFDQIAHDCLSDDRPFQYACWGVSRLSNTPALFERAHKLQVDFIEDTNLQERHLDSVLKRLSHLLESADDVYLTIDIDVLPASVAPGVSAPAAYGVPLSVIEAIAQTVKASGKMRISDLAEFNPRYDLDGHTARVCARLVWGLMGSAPKSL